MIYTKDKRSYVKPELEAVLVETDYLMDVSGTGNDKPLYGDPVEAKRNKISLSRGGFVDDMDFEEEEDDDNWGCW